MALLSYRQAALILGIDRKAIPALVLVAGIRPKKVKSNAKALGLSGADVAKLRRLLGSEKRPKAKASA